VVLDLYYRVIANPQSSPVSLIWILTILANSPMRLSSGLSTLLIIVFLNVKEYSIELFSIVSPSPTLVNGPMNEFFMKQFSPIMADPMTVLQIIFVPFHIETLSSILESRISPRLSPSTLI